MERSVSVSSDRNIRDHLWRWPTHFGRNIPTEIRRSIFDKPVLCPIAFMTFYMIIQKTCDFSMGLPAQ